MGQYYLRRVRAHRKTDKRYFVDKLPHNWSNILFLRKILPQAKFHDIRRPAMDCCFSNFTQSFSRAHASSFALEHIGQCYVDYVRLMTHLDRVAPGRSEEHTSELQSLMRISYAVFCWKKKKKQQQKLLDLPRLL